jgi:hypothetical protein
MGASDTFQSATPEDDVAVQKDEKPNNGRSCCGVADQKGGNGGAAPVLTVGRLSVTAVEEGERIPKGWVLDNPGEFYIPLSPVLCR